MKTKTAKNCTNHAFKAAAFGKIMNKTYLSLALSA